MMRLRFILMLVTLAACCVLHGADVISVEGEYTFYAESSHSPQEAKRLAVEGARVKALEKAFGTNVGQTVWQRVTESDEQFDLLSSTETRGEWIADTAEPEFDIRLADDGTLVVHCRVRGRARAISNEATEFTAAPLNRPDPSMQSCTFRNGDQMYLRFDAPCNGYVAAYIAMPDKNVYTLLPYIGNTSGQMKVRSGKSYVFFDSTSADGIGAGEVDEFLLNAPEGTTELNRLYVVFSPNPFSKAVDRYAGDLMPRQLSFADFARWLDKVRRNDPRMGVKIFNLEISNQSQH